MLGRRNAQLAEVIEGAKRGMDRGVPAFAAADCMGLPTSSASARRLLFLPLRLVLPMGWIGGR